MTLLWVGVLLLAALTGAWIIFIRRGSNRFDVELTRMRATILPATHFASDVDRIRASTLELATAQSRLDAVSEQIGDTFDSWTASVSHLLALAEHKRNRERRSILTAEPPKSRITVVGPGQPNRDTPRIAFANDPMAFPNRSPHLTGTPRDPKDTLGLKEGSPVTFVVPTLWIPPSDTTSSRWAVVTEDVLGVRAVDERLLKGWPEAQVTTRITDGQDKRPPDSGNVCSFCRDVRNPVTAALLHHPQTRDLFGFELGFWPTRRNEYENPLEWGLIFPDGAARSSPSYQQERELEARAVAGELRNDTVLDDFAMLARFPNPYGEGTALIVAGIRAIGTWGAAEYIRRHYDDLHARTDGGSFVSFLRVRAGYHVYPTEADGAVELLLVAASDKPAQVVEELDFRGIAA